MSPLVEAHDLSARGERRREAIPDPERVDETVQAQEGRRARAAPHGAQRVSPELNALL